MSISEQNLITKLLKKKEIKKKKKKNPLDHNIMKKLWQAKDNH